MLHVIPLVSQQRLVISDDAGKTLSGLQITDAQGRSVPCQVISQDDKQVILDGAPLSCWSPDSPVLYFAEAGDQKVRFGYCELETVGNQMVLVNGKPFYFRGAIRGIPVHDHPNMTGGDLKAAAVKYITQAKRFGFNLVRFHSTIPWPEFVEAADELGFFIHAEIGFNYDLMPDGSLVPSMDNENWVETVRHYRNNPSLAIFCIGNEMHNAGSFPQVQKLYEQGKGLAPNKLIMDNSGWGEYDRHSADIFSQHVAYYFPYKHHANMFEKFESWRINGSCYGEKLDLQVETPLCSAAIQRDTIPFKPVVAHEAAHYIEVIDYEKLNRKFDEFAAKVGPEYLEKFGISKPIYLTELPKLIKEKGLEDKYPDYILGSERWKEICLKQYFEELRFCTRLCGYEMLQFADCLAYENKNGIVDCFDDDKFISPEQFRQYNDDAVLLARLSADNLYADEVLHGEFYLSNFSQHEPELGTLTITLEYGGRQDTVYKGENYRPVVGKQRLCTVDFHFPKLTETEAVTIKASFQSGAFSTQNSWEVMVFPRPQLRVMPELALRDSHSFQELLRNSDALAQKNANLLVTDRLTSKIFDELAQGRTVLVLYHRDDEGNEYFLPGALERFKPCVWARGSNLGGVWANPVLRQAMGNRRYFDLTVQPLLEEAYKINTDTFPGHAIDELVFGCDKPVRDRMKVMELLRFTFPREDILRDFCHLGALRVGEGRLVICTMNRHRCGDPAAATFFVTLLNMLPNLDIKAQLSADLLKDYLVKETAAPRKREDALSRFWEEDKKLVEDDAHWTECGYDLTQMKNSQRVAQKLPWK